MICGTTPTHTFEIPFKKDEITDAWVMYGQGCDVILTKKMDDLVVEDGVIRCELSQENTLLFLPHKMVEVQLKIKLTGGEVVASNIATVPAQKIIDREMM